MPVPRKIREAAEAADAQLAAILEAESASLVVDPVTGEPNPPATPVVAPTPPTENFEQKYRSLQGKYDSEVPLLRSQLQNYERTNSALSAQVASLSDQVRILSTQVSATPSAGNVTDADLSQFGPELIDLMRRVASEQSGAATGSVRDLVAAEVANVRTDVSKLTQSHAEIARKAYDDGLTASVPNWRDINATREWLEWLAQFDPILGTTRQAAVSAAYEAYDVPRTVAFLKQYIALQIPASTGLTPEQELARQVSPQANSTVPVTTPVADPALSRVWTQDEIAEVYRNQIQGRNKLPADRFAAVEAEIAQAAAEGRVR